MKKIYFRVGIVLISILILLAIVSIFWTPYSPTKMSGSLKNASPSLSHICGCDNFGRDVFSRIMSGIGITFLIAFSTVFIGAFIGCLVGLLTGFYGGVVDEIIMRINDLLLSFPSVLLALVIISVLGKGKFKIIIALGILFIPSFARMIRAETIRIKKLGFIESARAMGIPTWKIIIKHVFPNVLPKLVTNITVGFNNAVIAEASMSYLGLGVQPPDQSLGRMISEAQSYIFVAPWISVMPGIVIILMIVGFSFIGESFEE